MTSKRHKPLYKQLLRLRKNVQNRSKIFKFKKKKWERFNNYSQKQLKFFKRFRFKDQYSLTVNRFSNRGNSFKRNYRSSLLDRASFKLYYGYVKQNYLKTLIKKTLRQLKTDENLLWCFEKRLDVVLYRAHFAYSIKNARQLILHKHVKVNEKIVSSQQQLLNSGDIVTVVANSSARLLIKNAIDMSNFWPLPPKYLCINYNTLQIYFELTSQKSSIPFFTYHFKISSIISSIKNLKN